MLYQVRNCLLYTSKELENASTKVRVSRLEALQTQIQNQIETLTNKMCIRDSIYIDKREYGITDEELERLAEEEINKLEWQKVIIINIDN